MSTATSVEQSRIEAILPPPIHVPITVVPTLHDADAGSGEPLNSVINSPVSACPREIPFAAPNHGSPPPAAGPHSEGFGRRIHPFILHSNLLPYVKPTLSINVGLSMTGHHRSRAPSMPASPSSLRSQPALSSLVGSGAEPTTVHACPYSLSHVVAAPNAFSPWGDVWGDGSCNDDHQPSADDDSCQSPCFAHQQHRRLFGAPLIPPTTLWPPTSPRYGSIAYELPSPFHGIDRSLLVGGAGGEYCLPQRAYTTAASRYRLATSSALPSPTTVTAAAAAAARRRSSGRSMEGHHTYHAPTPVVLTAAQTRNNRAVSLISLCSAPPLHSETLGIITADDYPHEHENGLHSVSVPDMAANLRGERSADASCCEVYHEGYPPSGCTGDDSTCSAFGESPSSIVGLFGRDAYAAEDQSSSLLYLSVGGVSADELMYSQCRVRPHAPPPERRLGTPSAPTTHSAIGSGLLSLYASPPTTLGPGRHRFVPDAQPDHPLLPHAAMFSPQPILLPTHVFVPPQIMNAHQLVSPLSPEGYDDRSVTAGTRIAPPFQRFADYASSSSMGSRVTDGLLMIAPPSGISFASPYDTSASDGPLL